MLQLAQNMVECVVIKTKRYEHIQPVLSELHWQPSISISKLQR